MGSASGELRNSNPGAFLVRMYVQDLKVDSGVGLQLT